MKSLGFSLGSGSDNARETLQMIGRDTMSTVVCALILPYLFMSFQVMIAGGRVDEVVAKLKSTESELQEKKDELAKQSEASVRLAKVEAELEAEKKAGAEARGQVDAYQRAMSLAEDYALTFILEPGDLTSASYEYDLVVQTPDGRITQEEQDPSEKTEQLDFRGSGRKYRSGIQKFVQDPAIVAKYGGRQVVPGLYKVLLRYRKASGDDTLHIFAKVAGKKPFVSQDFRVSARAISPQTAELFWVDLDGNGNVRDLELKF